MSRKKLATKFYVRKKIEESGGSDIPENLLEDIGQMQTDIENIQELIGGIDEDLDEILS